MRGGILDLVWGTYIHDRKDIVKTSLLQGLRKRLHVKLCKPWGLLYKSDGDSRRKIKRETNMGLAQAETTIYIPIKRDDQHPVTSIRDSPPPLPPPPPPPGFVPGPHD